jgi:hypothetical protein
MKRGILRFASAIPLALVPLLCNVPGGLPGGVTAASGQGSLLVDSDFESNATGKQLRAREQPQGWYESRRDGKQGRLQLKLSTKKIGGNATHKAMIKASPEFNTYLSQRLAEPQEGRLSLQWDIYVKDILPPYNRSAFQMIGNASIRGRGPNGAGGERFVFLAFERAAAPGMLNLFAFEGKSPEQWDARTLLVPDLPIKKWHTIRVDLDVPQEEYMVSVIGLTTEPIRVRAFKTKKRPIPTVLTHVSFASWNDGPGTFYVDNVRQP